MSEDANTAADVLRRSGTENRQKQQRVTIRLTRDERAKVEAAAGASGLTLASYMRESALTNPQTKRRRRPSVELATLARLLGETNRVGGNIHQLVKRVNFGETPAGEEVRQALAGYREVAASILAAMGRGK